MIQEPLFLSLCVIVKDGEKTLPALLASIEGAFDEYVFVDTGSTDNTKKIISEFFDQEWGFGKSYRTVEGIKRVVLEDYRWCDDFADARNYAFELATGKWRGYLDADDEFPKAKNLKPTLQRTEKLHPENNCASIGYAYVAGEVQQDVIRFVKWGEGEGPSKLGWRWEDEIHEHLTCSPLTRRISKYSDLNVIHHKEPKDHEAAYLRNSRIARKAYDKTTEPKKKARMAYHLSQEAKFLGQYDEAREYISEALEHFENTNIGAYCYSDLVRMSIDEGNLDEALNLAGMMNAKLPEFQEAPLLIGIIHTLRKDYTRASFFFDDAFKRPKLEMQSLEDVWFIYGYAPARAGLAYVNMGRFNDAEEILNKIPKDLLIQDEIRPLVREVNVKVMQQRGMKALGDYINYLIWDCEAYKALQLLEDGIVPSAISCLPEIGAAKRHLLDKIKHKWDWQEYQKRYADIPEDTYHTTVHDENAVLAQSRAAILLEEIEKLPKDGPDIRMAAIGYQDAIIEDKVMEINPRIHVTLVDVAPQASKGYKRLVDKYGEERVNTHAIVKNDTDWVSEENLGTFDAVVIFEVIEHVQCERRAFNTLHKMLNDDGVLFISTPIASQWVEPYLSDPKEGPKWFGHLRAYNHVEFWNILRLFSFDGTLYEGYDGTFVAKLDKNPFEDRKPIAIHIPGTPNPFDAVSHHEGFLGGSEECVIHLAEELAISGYDVTVFTPQKERHNKIRGRNGVLWRDVSEFDPLTEDYKAVLFWRSAAFIHPEAKYKKLLWLHDAYYGVKPEDYKRADKVLVLSDTHEQSITKHDGYEGPFTHVMNGIDKEAFPEPNEDERDPYKFIYASSPDRGLQRLLKMWPRIRMLEPKATLDIYYDWSGYYKMFPKEAAQLKKMVQDLEDRGVTYYGGVSHDVLHEAYRKAGVWAYPNHGEVETFCISAVKAMASGCWPIVTEAGALEEVVLRGVWTDEHFVDTDFSEESGIDYDLFLKAIAHYFKNIPSTQDRKRLRENALLSYDWEFVAQDFVKAIED